MDTTSMRHVGGTLQRLAAGRRLLILPGWGGSGPTHWQSLWERACPEIERVEQDDWATPRAEDWRARLDGVIARESSPAILIAHSLGCWLAADWAQAGGAGVAGALLVAPPDLREHAPEGPVGFDAIALRPLPFPALVVSSDNDPFVPLARAREFAHAWQADFVQAESRGHLGDTAGLHLWPEGIGFLARLLSRLAQN